MAKSKRREVTCLPQIMSGLGVLFLLAGLPLLVLAASTVLSGVFNMVFAFLGWVVEKAGILLAGWILLVAFSKK